MYEKVNAEELNQKLTLLANKIKEINNTTNQLEFPNEFIEEINNTYVSSDWLDKTKPVGEIIYNGTNIPAYFLYQRTGITSFVAPNATGTVGNSAFAGTSSLKNSLFLPKCNAGSSSFSGSSASTIVLNSINKGTTYNFSSALACNIDILSNSHIGTHCFSSLNYIQNFIFRSSSIVTLGSVEWGLPLSVFGEGKRGANIYIPKILYDHLGDGTSQDYKSATNWTTFDGYGTINWNCIEGSIYETQYADGTPISIE